MWWLLFVVALPLALTSCPFGFVYQEQFNRGDEFVRYPFFTVQECHVGAMRAETSPCSCDDHYESQNFNQKCNCTNSKAGRLCGTNLYASQQGIKGPFYTGLNRLSQSDWSWTDGNPLSYTRWAPESGCWDLQNFDCSGEPNVSAQCAAANSTDATWVSVSCSDAYPYVCVQQLTIPTMPTCPPPLQPATCPACPAVPGHCPSEWTYYSKTDACYKAFLDSAFDQAETVCQSTGGHLTSIHSNEENVFVSSLTHMGIEYRTEKHLTWIGLRKPSSPANSTWTWTDGSVVDYLLWAPGKPQDITGIQNCAQMYTDSLGKNPDKDTDYRRWNDVQCATTMRAYVCKQPALH